MVVDVLFMLRGVVTKYCNRHGIEGDDVEQIFSEVCLKALNWAEAYDPSNSAWTTYAYRCAELYCIQAWRQFVRPKAFQLSEIEEKTARQYGVLMPPEGPQMLQDRRKQLKAAMDRLKKTQQIVVRMRFMEGRTLADIAAAMNLTKQRVEQIEKAALARLKEILPD